MTKLIHRKVSRPTICALSLIFFSWILVTLSSNNASRLAKADTSNPIPTPITEPVTTPAATDTIANDQVPNTPITNTSTIQINGINMPLDYIAIWPPVADTFIWSGEPNYNYGAGEGLWIGDQFRTLIRWDLSSIPQRAMISSAAARIEVLDSDYSGNMNIAAHAMNNSWTESGATWNSRNGTNAWNTPGGDFNASPEDVVWVGTTRYTLYSWNITNLLAEWHSGWTNNGILLQPASYPADWAKIVGSRESSGWKPQLDIYYTLGPVSLSHNTPFSWGVPSPDWYKITRGSYWNAVAIRPPANSDYDLELHSTSNYNNQLASSIYGTNSIDFIVIDGNHAPSGDFFPKVYQYNGRGQYSIEHVPYAGILSAPSLASNSSSEGKNGEKFDTSNKQDLDSLTGTHGPYTMQTDSIIRIWDANLVNGVTYNFVVRPSSGNADLGISLHKSTAGTASTYYQGRSAAVAQTDSVGAGQSEQLVYTANGSDWYGFAVWNKSATSATTFNIYMDATPPTGNISINNGATYASSTSVTLNLSAVDNETGVMSMRFSNSGAPTGSWISYSPSYAWTLSSGGGVKTVYAQFQNYAGMVSEVYTDSIILDQTPPTGSISINNGAAYATSTSVTLNLNATDNESGVMSMRFSNTGTPTGGWVSYSPTYAWTLSSSGGLKTVYAQFQNNAGLVSEVFTDSIILDQTPPTGAIRINNDATYANTTSVTLNLNAVDNESNIMSMRFSNSGPPTGSWISYSPTYSWALTSGDGVKTVYAQFQNNAGLVSEVFSDSITLDQTPPGGTISINNGAAYVNTTSVTLNLTAVDNQSGVMSMRFSNSGPPTGSWIGYNPTHAWALNSGEGVKTVYAQFQDRAGNVSNVYSHVITLDQTPPTAAATCLPETNAYSFPISWSGNDSSSGIASYDVQYKVGATGTWANWNSDVTSTVATFGPNSPIRVQNHQTYYFRARARDRAGNISAYSAGLGDCSTHVNRTFSAFLPITTRCFEGPWEIEPNNVAPSEANGPICFGITYYGRVRAEDKDYFFFDLPTTRQIQISLTNMAIGEDYNLVLRDDDENLTQIGYSANLDNTPESIDKELQAGRYYIQIVHSSGTGNQPYHLKVVSQN